MRENIEKILNYYMTRASQFANLESALECFENDWSDQEMWEYLFEYILRKEEADNMFDLFDKETITMLAGFNVNFIVGIADGDSP